MARLKTLHRRRRRKLFGPTIPRADVGLLILCNKFAPSRDAYTVVYTSPRDFGAGYYNSYRAHWDKREGKPLRYDFKRLFYALKDAVMDVYGRPVGYACQHWTSYAEDYYGDVGEADGCHHYHILERVRVGGKVFHRPTGHFDFYNNVTDYYKHTVGFGEMRKRCVETLEGRKREQKYAMPDPAAALAALTRLVKRYGHLLPREREQERPRVVTGNYMMDSIERGLQSERAKLAARAEVQCHYCLKTFTGAEVSRIEGHDFCAPCKAKAFELESVPF